MKSYLAGLGSCKKKMVRFLFDDVKGLLLSPSELYNAVSDFP